jgi:hypothetical protein
VCEQQVSDVRARDQQKQHRCGKHDEEVQTLPGAHTTTDIVVNAGSCPSHSS